MTRIKSDFKHKQFDQSLVASLRLVLDSRDELPGVIHRLKHQIPEQIIEGPPFSIIQFVTSVQDGMDAEVGFPVSTEIDSGEVRTRRMPAMEVLSFIHKGSLEDIGSSYSKLYRDAYRHGLISDEFCREVYLNLDLENECEIEIQFIIHRWDDLLAAGVEDVLGEKTARCVMQGSELLNPMSSVDERFKWVRGAMDRLETVADEAERYDVVSRCAHVFPSDQISKLNSVYEKARQTGADQLEAVDAVIAFMGEDPGWGEIPHREGRIIYSTKAPRDADGYQNAQNDLERKKAYCFCPLIREHLDQGMPVTFCYCGSGWYRQQWEGALGRPVSIEIVRSLLKGDDRCEFAIRLPDDLK
jgi:effector-binding domain-containing protein